MRINRSIAALAISLTMAAWALPAFASLAADTFKDVPIGHWAQEGVEVVAIQRDLMKGYPDGTFRGDDPFTRLQFAYALKDLVREIESIGKTSLRPAHLTVHVFSDQPTGPDRQMTLVLANDYDLFERVPGITRDHFGGDTPVSRDEMATVLDNLMHLAQAKDIVRPRQVPKHYAFSDLATSDPAYPDVQDVANRYDVMVGFPDGTFRGNDRLTRYQFAQAVAQTVPLIQELITQTTERKIEERYARRLQGLTPWHFELRSGGSLGGGAIAPALGVRWIGYPGSLFLASDTRIQPQAGTLTGAPSAAGWLLDEQLSAFWKTPLLGSVQLQPYVGLRGTMDPGAALFGGVGYGLVVYDRILPKVGLAANLRGSNLLLAQGQAGAGLPAPGGMFLGSADGELEYYFSPKLAGVIGVGLYQAPSGYRNAHPTLTTATALEGKLGLTLSF